MTSGAPESSVRSGTWRRWIERAVVALVLGTIVLFVGSNWSEVRVYPWAVRWPRLIAATGCVFLAYSLFVIAWRRLLAGTGGSVTLSDAHRIWYFGNLARYVPGKVLQIAGTAYLARRKGVGAGQTVVASVLAQVFVIGVALSIAAPTLGDLPGTSAPVRVAAWSSGAILLAVLASPLLDRIVAMALRIVRSDAPVVATSISSRLALIVLYAVAWGVFGFGFYLLATGLIDEATVPITHQQAIGVHAAAYAGGWLALLTPGGLGVREGLYTLLLAPSVPTGAAAVLAIAARLWLTACELAATAFLAVGFGWKDLSINA